MKTRLSTYLLPLFVGAVSVLGLFGGCNDRALTLFTVHETFKQADQLKVDILWVLDSSTSMLEEKDLVIAGSSDFVNALLSSNADFRLGVITMNIQSQSALGNNGFEDDSGILQQAPGVEAILSSNDSATEVSAGFNDTVSFIYTDPSNTGKKGKGCEAALEAAVDAVNPELQQADGTLAPRNPGFLREDAALALIFLTDEDDASTNDKANDVCQEFAAATFPKEFNTVDEYVDFFQTLKAGRVSINGIITLNNDATCASVGANPEEESKNLEKAIDATLGFKRSICTQNYTTFLDELGLKIAQAASKFQLKYPVDASTLVVEVNGTAISANDYVIDSTKKGVTINLTLAPTDKVKFTYKADPSGLTLVN